MSILLSLDSAEFNELLEKTDASRGNLSVQLSKLKEAGYLEMTKGYKGNYPLTTCAITKAGINAFEEYVDSLQEYIKKGKD